MSPGFTIGVGAAAEGVDRRGHRLDRGEVAAWPARRAARNGYVGPKRSSTALAAGPQREAAIGAERVVIVERAVGEGGALGRLRRRARPWGSRVRRRARRSHRGHRSSQSRRGAPGIWRIRDASRTRPAPRCVRSARPRGRQAQPVLVEAGVDRHDVRERERARAGRGARRSRGGRRGARRARSASARTTSKAAPRQVAVHRAGRWVGRQVEAAEVDAPPADAVLPTLRGGCPTDARTGTAVMRPSTELRRACAATRRTRRRGAAATRRASRTPGRNVASRSPATSVIDGSPFHVPNRSAGASHRRYWFGLSPLFAAASRSASAARIGIGSWPTSSKRAASSSTVQRPSLRMSRTSAGWFHTATRPPLTV